MFSEVAYAVTALAAYGVHCHADILVHASAAASDAASAVAPAPAPAPAAAFAPALAHCSRRTLAPASPAQLWAPAAPVLALVPSARGSP